MTESAENRVDDFKKRLEGEIAKDLRDLRKSSDQTLDQVSQFLGHERNWLSKIERNKQRIYLSDFLLIVNKLRDVEPDHPAVKMVEDLHARSGPAARRLQD